MKNTLSTLPEVDEPEVDGPEVDGPDFDLSHLDLADPDAEDRPLRQAMLRGWRRRCPCCGSGPLLRGYLTVRDTCAVCGEEFYHQRAEDGPAYLTIVLVGHLMAPVLFWAFVTFRPDPLVLASLFSVGSVALSAYLLPRLKGMMVGIQWSRRMNGFGDGAA